MGNPALLRKNIAVESSVDIQQISQPLMKMGIDIFGYHRLYDDGTEFMLHTDAAWAEHFHNKNFIIEKELLEKLGLDKFEYVIWPLEFSDNLMRTAKEISQFTLGMTLRLASKNYYEFFSFATKLSPTYSINLFLNNIAVLKKFSFYFKNSVSHILKKCEANRIIFSDTVRLSRNRLKNMRGKENSNDFLTSLSGRELDCARHILMGKSMRETAQDLSISPRTVETHIVSIKNKLGCSKKSEAISKLLKMNSMHFALWSN